MNTQTLTFAEALKMQKQDLMNMGEVLTPYAHNLLCEYVKMFNYSKDCKRPEDIPTGAEIYLIIKRVSKELTELNNSTFNKPLATL